MPMNPLNSTKSGVEAADCEARARLVCSAAGHLALQPVVSRAHNPGHPSAGTG